MTTGKVLLGVLAGVAAGALIGVLLAPDKGSNTRKKIVGDIDDYSDSIKDKMNEFLEGIAEKLNIAKEDVSEFAEQQKSKFRDDKNAEKRATV